MGNDTKPRQAANRLINNTELQLTLLVDLIDYWHNVIKLLLLLLLLLRPFCSSSLVPFSLCHLNGKQHTDWT